MKNLGKKGTEMYPSMVEEPSKNKIVYPGGSLPISLLSKENDLGSEVTITIKAKITGMQKTKYNKNFDYEAIEAEVK